MADRIIIKEKGGCLASIGGFVVVICILVVLAFMGL
jgi:hypothetical protein